MTIAAFLAVFLFIAILDAYPPTRRELVGIAQVIDGDGLRLEGDQVRLLGIDAVEFDQTCETTGQDWACGRAATQSLERLAQGQRIRCETAGLDDYGRRLGTCYSVAGVNINREQVALGWAVADGPRYMLVEHDAKTAKKGIWASRFERPSFHRRLAN